MHQRAREDRPSSRPGSIRHTLHRKRILSPDLDHSDASLAPVTGGTSDIALRTSHSAVALSPGGMQSCANWPSDIEDMLRAHGLPIADTQRIALLFASLGIADRTYLRVFSRLASSCEAWFSKMRQEGQLSEIQAWVVVDMLDTVVVD